MLLKSNKAQDQEGDLQMAYVIAEPCIGTKDSACVDACPVDCIHPKKDEKGYAENEQLFIDPVECIDCGACVPVCARFRPSTRATTCRTSGFRSRRRMRRTSADKTAPPGR